MSLQDNLDIKKMNLQDILEIKDKLIGKNIMVFIGNKSIDTKVADIILCLGMFSIYFDPQDIRVDPAEKVNSRELVLRTKVSQVSEIIDARSFNDSINIVCIDLLQRYVFAEIFLSAVRVRFGSGLIIRKIPEK